MMLLSYILTALVVVAIGYLLLSLLIQRLYRAPRRVETGTPADFGLPFHTVAIPTENGRRLHAWYVPSPAASENAPAVVAIHGWGGNAEVMLPFAVLLHRAGYATLLLDARNHGRSDADTFSSMPRFAEDLEHGFDWLAARTEIDPQRIALLGHSVGAGAALLVASRREDVAAVVSIAAFAHPQQLMRRQMESHRIPYRPVGWLVLHYIERTIGHRFDAIAPINTIRNIRCPVLLVHGCEDRSVPVSDAEAIHAQRAHRRVDLLTLPGAEHDSVEHIERHGSEIVTFLQGSFDHEAHEGLDGIPQK
jgi:dipeptidyl aminopeptidase/acylaminoacyl peptidase